PSKCRLTEGRRKNSKPRPLAPHQKGGICVSTVSFVCTKRLFSDPRKDGLIAPRPTAVSSTDHADGVFSARAHLDHSRPRAAFTRERERTRVEWLGDRGFLQTHGVRFPYVAGAMANGIATPRLVVAMARAGMLGFFGAAGLSFHAVEAGLDEIIRTVGG